MLNVTCPWVSQSFHRKLKENSSAEPNLNRWTKSLQICCAHTSYIGLYQFCSYGENSTQIGRLAAILIFLIKICKWLLLRNRWTKSLQIWCAHTCYKSLPILFICWQFNPKCPNGGHFDFLNYKYAKSHFSPLKTWEFQVFHKYVIKLLFPKESSAAIRITKFSKMADLWPFCDWQMCKITFFTYKDWEFQFFHK